MTVRIVTDSACDLPESIADEHGIEIVPLTIRFGDEEFVDREELRPPSSGRGARAAARCPRRRHPRPGVRSGVPRAAAEGATGIVVVSLSGALSATMQSAELAAATVAPTRSPVRVVDSRSVTLGLGTIAIACAASCRRRRRRSTRSPRLAADLAAARGSAARSTRSRT